MLRRRFVTGLLLASLLVLVSVAAALAFPPLPASFYGAVQLDGRDVPDGTLVEATIDGLAYAHGQTRTYGGHSVYSLDVPGDETDSPQCEGGRQGQDVRFTIAGHPAAPAGVWRSGTNTRLDLSATTAPEAPAGSPAAPAPSAAIAGGGLLTLAIGGLATNGLRRRDLATKRGDKA